MRTLALLALLASPAGALGKPEYELELDPYYSAAAMTVAFSSGAAEGKADEELSTYRDLTRKALLPRFAILEASVNPLPLLGVGYRAVSEDAYRRAKVTPSLNYWRARKLTFSMGVGFQWLSKEKYTGTLALRRLRPESRILIRPNIKF